MAIKRLVVCGCSYMTTSFYKYNQIKGYDWPDFPSTIEENKNLSKLVVNELIRFDYFKHHYPSFIDTFAKNKNYEHINLAHGGSGNFAIRIQIEQALKFNPDYVIIGASVAERFDFIKLPYDHNKLIRNFDNRNPDMLGDIYGILSDINEVDYDPNIALDDLSEEEKKIFLTKMIDTERKKINDYYLIQNGLDLLSKNSIPYVFLPGPLKSLDWSDYNIVWPTEAEQPWDKWGYRHGNHRSIDDHEMFYHTLINLTKNWK